MSTTFAKIEGKTEIPNPTEMKSEYVNEHITLTSFWGGVGRGKCIQITNSGGTFHIQIDNKNVDTLIKMLLLWKNNAPLSEIE